MPKRSALPRGSGDKTKRAGPRADVVYVRLTGEEHARIAEAARRARSPVGVWARARLLDAADAPLAQSQR
jgi:hypothetical protein